MKKLGLNHRIIYCEAKITPTKNGQFVTLWKRVDQNPIQPFDLSDPFDQVIVQVSDNENFGEFIFPKEVLLEHGVISDVSDPKAKPGKRAFRVYPPWVKTESRQAERSQKWQCAYFSPPS